MEARVIFEWDERKRQINLRKHGLDFAGCAEVFAGWVTTTPDDRCNYDEDRFVTFGLLRNTVVSIVHTETGDVVRIISLRKATRHEQAYYYEKIPQKNPD